MAPPPKRRLLPMPDDPRSYQNPSKKAELLAESREYGKKASEAEALRPSSASRWEVLGGTTGDIESALIRDTVTGRARTYRVGDFLPDGSGVQEVRRGGMGTMSVSLIDEGGREGWVGAPPPAPAQPSKSVPAAQPGYSDGAVLAQILGAARNPTLAGREAMLSPLSADDWAGLAEEVLDEEGADDVLADWAGPYDEILDEDGALPYLEPFSRQMETLDAMERAEETIRKFRAYERYTPQTPPKDR
jgi:hypothetical protein